MTRRTFVKQAGAATLLAGSGVSLGGCTADAAGELAVKILVVGGGAAGLDVAARLRRRLRAALITIVDPAEKHYYQPGFTFIGAGVWQPQDVWVAERDLIPAGCKWIQRKVAAIEPDHKRAVLDNGDRLEYDFLVLVPGIQEDWNAIEGISRETLGQGNAHSIYDFEGSVKTWAAIREFVRKGGRGLYTDTWTKHKCGGAPKKICLLTEHYARQQERREQVTLDYFTAEKQLYDVPHFTPRLLEIYKERQVPIRLTTRLVGVDTQKRRAYFRDTAAKKDFTEDYDFLHFAPPQSAPDFVKKSGLSWTEGKLAAGGWVMVDKETFVHKKYASVISLGDVAGIPTSKTSAAIRKQAPIAVENICALIRGDEPKAKYNGYAACPIITDYGHVIMAEFDYEKKPDSSFPFTLLDTRRELRSAWWLKKYVLKPMYFSLMCRGLA